MAKYKETIDLYDDAGKQLKSGVPLEKISPVINPATRKLIDLTKRTIAVNLGGIQESLKTGKVAKGGYVLGREMNLDIIGNKDAIIGKIKEMVQVEEGDDTKIREFSGGKLILVEAPKARLEAASTYDAAITSVAAATTYALVEQFNIGAFDAAMIKAAVWGGSYPHTMDLSGANVTSILSIPQNNEGLGYALRNIPVNHTVMMTGKNAMQGAALSSTFEQAGMFEMGNAIGPFERAQLLTYAYQGLNANNLVYELVKKNGATGTIGTVVQSLVERAIEDKVIVPPGKKAGTSSSTTRRTRCSGTPTLPREPWRPPWSTAVPDGSPRQSPRRSCTSTTCLSTRPVSPAVTTAVSWVPPSDSRSSATRSTVAAAPVSSTATTS